MVLKVAFVVVSFKITYVVIPSCRISCEYRRLLFTWAETEISCLRAVGCCCTGEDAIKCKYKRVPPYGFATSNTRNPWLPKQ